MHRARSYDLYVDPLRARAHRIRRILDSIHTDLHEGGTAQVRQILSGPRELYRIELARPDLAYQRTTILDGDTLEELIEETPDQLLRERLTFRD